MPFHSVRLALRFGSVYSVAIGGCVYIDEFVLYFTLRWNTVYRTFTIRHCCMLRWLCVTRRSAVYVSSFKNFYYTLIYTYIHINILYIPHIRTRSILLSPAVLRPVQNHQYKDEPPLSLCQRYINWVLTKISHRIRDQVSFDGYFSTARNALSKAVLELLPSGHNVHESHSVQFIFSFNLFALCSQACLLKILFLRIYHSFSVN